MTQFHQIFPLRKPIVGMIALPPLPGYPEFTRMDEYIERALGDLDTLQRGGVDGVCVENDYDHPHTLTAGPEIVAPFTRIAGEVARAASVPVGLEVLLNDWRASLAIALAVGAQFIRMDFFVDRVRIKAGVIEPEPEAVLAFRARIKAEHVALFTDVQVKYSESLEPGKRLASSVQQAMAHGADAVIVSGQATGSRPTLADVEEARAAAGMFPVLLGSGVAPDNARELLAITEGALVGTALKDGTEAHHRPVLARVQRLMDAVRPLRGESGR